MALSDQFKEPKDLKTLADTGLNTYAQKLSDVSICAYSSTFPWHIQIDLELSTAARATWMALSPPINNFANEYKYVACFHLLSK